MVLRLIREDSNGNRDFYEDFNEKANEIQIEIQSLVNSNVPVLVS